MRLPRVRFTMRWLMIAVVLAGLIFAGIAASRRARQRRIDLLTAQAAYEQAHLTREVAEIEVTEYVEGIYKRQLDAVKGEKIAWSDAALERARRRRAALEKEPRDQIKMLKDEVAKARADESAKSAELEQAKAAAARLLW
jgi:hypothetical protein